MMPLSSTPRQQHAHATTSSLWCCQQLELPPCIHQKDGCGAVENSTLPQCLCWTDWEIQHRSEQWLLPDACWPDTWVETRDREENTWQCLWVTISISVTAAMFTFKQYLHSGSFVPLISDQHTLFSDVDSALVCRAGAGGGPMWLSAGGGGGRGGTSLCLLLCGWSARLLKLLSLRRVGLQR